MTGDLALADRARAVLDDHWMPEGYCAPNLARYPWQWLWDSCFHAIVWAELGDERALTELRSCFRWQAPDGFVPHMGYQRDPAAARAVWGRDGASTLTQPPMFGHAAAELARRGMVPDDEVLERARRGLAHLLARRRRRPDGLVVVLHPWETGADDSPRWDAWLGQREFRRDLWLERKLAMLDTLEVSADATPVANRSFTAAPASFNALLAFNLMELGALLGDRQLVEEGRALGTAIESLWDEPRATWVDSSTPLPASGGARTLDGLLPALVSAEPTRVGRALAQALDDEWFGGPFGPAGVHRQEAAFDPSAYGRGSAWPHLTYLLWVAAGRHGRTEAAAGLAQRLLDGALRSGFAEYWNPDTGEGLGAAPQSWTALALVVGAVSGVKRQ